jgi:hypothetical protein
MKAGLPWLRGLSHNTEKKKTPTWREMLELRPVRNPTLEWSEENERVILCIRQTDITSWKARLLNLIAPMPGDRRVALDAIGTDVWNMVDGKNTVGRIAKELAKKYKLEPREAQLSLQQYFKELGRRGYIGFLTEKSEVTSQKSE